MKILSLFIIVILLAGFMPISLAKENSIKATLEIDDDLSIKDQNSEQELITSKAIQLKSENSGKGSVSDSEDELEVSSETKVEFNKRKLKEEIKIEASEKFKKAEVEFKLKSDNSQELEAKIKMLKECKEDNSNECQELKRNAIDHSKKYLINLIDRIIAYLEKLEARIESSEEISTGTAQFSLEEIKALKEQLVSIKAEVEAATTKDQIIELSNKLRILLENKIKVNAKLHLEKLRLFKIGEIIERSEHLQLKLNEVLEELKEEGNFTEDVDDLIAKFNTLLDDAKVNYYAAVELFAKAKDVRDSNPEEAKKLILEAHAKLKTSHQDLQEAHSVLVKLYKLVKDERGDIETRCWEDKPLYKPGQELGFFIWQGSCRETWFIDWSGDLRKTNYETNEENAERLESDSSLSLDEQIRIKRIKAELLKQRLGIKEKLRIRTSNSEIESETTGDLIKDTTELEINSRGSTNTGVTNETKAYHITGKITTNGKFIDVGPRKFERKDSFKWADSEITFDAYVSTHSDGLRFRTTGTEVTFDLMIDGKQVKELVFIGNERKNPNSIPFTLTGNPATSAMCKRGEVLYEGTCQKKLMAEDSRAVTEVQVASDGSMMMEMQ